MADPLDGARYISFGTFRRDGTLVATPTWVVPYQGGYAFTTGPESFKVKRLSRNPEVRVAPCDVRGRVKAGVPSLEGTARVLDEAALGEVQSLVRRKYPIAWLITISPRRALDRLRGRRPVADCAIGFELSGA